MCNNNLNIILFVLIICIYKSIWNISEPFFIKDYVYTKISKGYIKGYVVKTLKNKTSYIFKRIPFARPPIKKLRFENLKSSKPWNFIWDATYYSSSCLSNTTKTLSPQSNISEDCIYANIFADSRCFKSKKKCPVIFFIHGGKFLYDSAVMFNEREIVEKYASNELIFVIPAFRLGIFGTFDIDNENIVSKNLGLKDILFALKWVFVEIHNFGGDANRITLMGSSSGANVVEIFLTSPTVSKKLFKYAIVNSPTFSIVKNGHTVLSMAILNHFKCFKNETTNLTYSKINQVNCLRKIYSIDLLEAQRHFIDDLKLPHSQFVPSRDILSHNFGKLLTKLKPTKIWLTATQDEFDSEECKNLSNKYCTVYSKMFGYTSQKVVKACVKHYQNNSSEEFIKNSMIHVKLLMTSIVNTHKGGTSYRSLFKLDNHTLHSNDMLFFIGLHMINKTYSTAEKLMNKYYPTIVQQFVKNGFFSKDWKPSEKNGKGFYVLNFKVKKFNEFKKKVVEKPHFESGFEKPTSAKFWLIDAAKLEFKKKLIL